MIRKLIMSILLLSIVFSLSAQLGPGSFSTITTQKFRVGANATYITDTKITSIGADSTSTTKYGTLRAHTAYFNTRIAEFYNMLQSNSETVLTKPIVHVNSSADIVSKGTYSFTVTFTGALTTDAVYATVVSGPPEFFAFAKITSDGNALVTVFNTGGSTVNHGSVTYRLKIFR